MIPDREESFSKRMKIVASIVGNASLLAERTGISRRAIGLYLAGKSDPTREKLVVIASAANVNLGWLATGDSPVFKEEPRSTGYTPSVCKTVTEPVCCGQIPCPGAQGDSGFGHSTGEQGREPFIFCNGIFDLELGVSHDNLLLVKIQDDAMEPTIRRDDIVLFNKEIGHIAHDGIYVIALEETLLVRRIQQSFDGAAYLICDNQLYEKQWLDKNEVTALKISGKAIWAGTRI